jgi:hypothetical protein
LHTRKFNLLEYRRAGARENKAKLCEDYRSHVSRAAARARWAKSREISQMADARARASNAFAL